MPRDEPWIFRTYAGYGNPRVTNERFKMNLAKGQTGLSVAFDLPTQMGYDSDHAMAKGEVGRVGVPICHLGDMRMLFDGLPVEKMNTSMTINATAVWLFALYVAVADEHGAPRAQLAGTTQNDIVKEFLARGTHVFPPEASMRLATDLVAWADQEAHRWNPINVCSYHLQEAGADPILEIAYTLANAISVLDHTRDSGQVPPENMPRVVGRISFFCNSGMRLIEEICKLRAFTRLWDRVARERYGVDEPHYRRFRYGVQVNSLGLTASQPENNVYRILLETLPVVLSKNSRARAVQLPAWNEALGLPRAWDQQWSLRAQQVLAYETDLLEYADVLEGSTVIEEMTERIMTEAWEELQTVLDKGGATNALAYMKESLVASNARRLRQVESGDLKRVGVNVFTDSAPSLLSGEGVAFDRTDPADESLQLRHLDEWKARRDGAAAERAIDELKAAARGGRNLVDPSIEAAKAGVTTGEWTDALREVFGEFRAPTGLGAMSTEVGDTAALAAVRERVKAAAAAAGVSRLRMLIGKPGLDGHSNAAEQVAVRARDAGFEVVYQGIRLTPEEIAQAASDEDVQVVGLSILSGAHNILVPEVLERMWDQGIDTERVPVVVGGVIPDEDVRRLHESGVARVYTPHEHDITEMIGEIADLIAERSGGRS